MSGSAGAGKSESAGGGMSDDFYIWLETIAAELYKESKPLRHDFISTLESALKGETEGGMIPIASNAVESARQAASRTEQATTEDLARTGLSGTPFGASILSQTKQQGEQAGWQAETDILQQLINMIPNYTLGLGQTATMPSAPGYSESRGGEFSLGGGKE